MDCMLSICLFITSFQQPEWGQGPCLFCSLTSPVSRPTLIKQMVPRPTLSENWLNEIHPDHVKLISKFVLKSSDFWIWSPRLPPWHIILKSISSEKGILWSTGDGAYTQTSWEENLAVYIRIKNNNNNNECWLHISTLRCPVYKNKYTSAEGMCARMSTTSLNFSSLCYFCNKRGKKKNWKREKFVFPRE